MSSPLLIAYERQCEAREVRPNKTLRRLLQQEPLTELELEEVYLGAKGVAAVLGIIRLAKSLQSLGLRNCQLTNDLVVELCQSAASHPSLQRINLSKNSITLPAAKAVLQLAQENPNIVEVLLEESDVSDHYIDRINLQMQVNTERKQPNKDNVLVDEESRKESDPTEEWEWNTNYGDQDLAVEIAAQDNDFDASAVEALPFDPDEDDEPSAAIGPQGPQALNHRPVLPSLPIDILLKQQFNHEEGWLDPHFPPDANSIFTKCNRQKKLRRARGLEWRRFKDMEDVSAPTLFGTGSQAFSPPVPGSLEDLWFISALGILRRNPAIIKRLFTATYPDMGIYQVQFCKNGEWAKVVIDDWIPCDAEGHPKFSSCRDPNQMWVPLLEKAYAKLHGGYDRLSLGSSVHALSDLTGGECHGIAIPSLTFAKQLAGDGTLWSRLSRVLKQGGYVGGAYRARGTCMKHASAIGNGVAPNHLYAVDRLIEYQGWKLVVLDDPWGKALWTGRFSSPSTGLTTEICQACGIQFADEDRMMKRPAGAVVAADDDTGDEGPGSDFMGRAIIMAFEDFATYFNKFYVCRMFGDPIALSPAQGRPTRPEEPNDDGMGGTEGALVPTAAPGGTVALIKDLRANETMLDCSAWKSVNLVGEWRGRSAGGRFREQNFTENPCFSLQVREKSTPVCIQISQLDARMDGRRQDPEYPLKVGFYVFRTSDHTRKKKHYSGPQDTLHTATFVASRQAGAELTLQPTSSYLIVPCTGTPGQEAKFGLTVWSPRPIVLEEVEDLDHEYRAKGWWRRDTAGGRITGYDTWMNNPQFHLKMKQQARACVSLAQLRGTSGGALPPLSSTGSVISGGMLGASTTSSHYGEDDESERAGTRSIAASTITGTIMQDQPGEYFHIAFYIFRGDGKPIREYNAKSLVGFVDFLPYRTVFREFDLDVGDYIIIPMTWTKGQQSPFELSVYTTATATLKRLHRVVEKS